VQRGVFNMTRGIPMTSHVLRQAVARAKIEGGEVEEVSLALARSTRGRCAR
jgi:acetyl-CoA C-acetyltransferase